MKEALALRSTKRVRGAYQIRTGETGGNEKTPDLQAIRLHYDYRAEPGYRADAVWEHKKGKVWRLVEKLERQNRTLIYANRVLQARVRRLDADSCPPVGETGRAA